MKRKVIKQGHNTLTITLPTKWAKKNKISAGDELDVSEEGNGIIVSSKHKDRQLSAEVYVKKPKRLISRHIFNLYRRGVDEIKVRYDDPIIIKDINSYLPLLMGFEITQQSKDFSILKSFHKINEEEFKNALRRYLLITKSIAEETYTALKGHSFDELEGIIELEKAQNRLYMYLCRVINMRGSYILEYPTFVYLIIHMYEDIADDYKYICKYFLERKKKIPRLSGPTLRMMKEVNESLDLLYNFYYKYDLDTGRRIIEEKKRLIIIGLDLLEKVPKHEIRIIHILNNLIVKIYRTVSPIFGMKI